MTKLLLRQKHVCRDKSFVIFAGTKLCLSRQKFVAASMLLSRQIRVLSRQIRVFFRDFATNTCLSRQKSYLWQFPPMIVQWVWPGVTGYRVLPFRGVSLQSWLSPFWCYRFSIYTIHFPPLSVPVTSFSIICCPCSVSELVPRSFIFVSPFPHTPLPPPHQPPPPLPHPLTSSVTDGIFCQILSDSVSFCQKAYYNRTILQLIW